MLRGQLLCWYKWSLTFRVYGFLDAEMCGERMTLFPEDPHELQIEHEDSGYPIWQVKCGGP
jgi:hypothetical protein